MNEDDYATLLQTIRQLAHATGRSDLDASLFRSRLRDTSDNRAAVLAYLYGLHDDIALRHETTLGATMRRLGRFSTQDDGSIEGIVVDINEQDRTVFNGLEQVDLFDFAETGNVLAYLTELIAEIETDQGAQ